jgi:hypothetical protein
VRSEKLLVPERLLNRFSTSIPTFTPQPTPILPSPKEERGRSLCTEIWHVWIPLDIDGLIGKRGWVMEQSGV